MKIARTAKFLASLMIAPVLAGTMGCGTDAAPSVDNSFVPAATALQKGTSFVGIKRDGLTTKLDAPVGTLDITGDSDHFYMAVHRRALDKKYFLSAYLKQLFPGAVSYGAARSLGTRVVKLKIQNGKLFVFSADDIKKTSDTFDPEVLVDAYPIVTDFAAFNEVEGAADYVLIDPSAGLNRFNAYSDMNGEYGVRFETELAYGQRFRVIGDGVTFETVFTGYADVPDPQSWQLGENNTLRGSGTLGMALREYSESEGFVPAPFNPRYFYGDIQLIANTGEIDAPSAKWAIKPGMKPIVWKISPQFVEVAKNEAFKDFDLVGAVKNGITRWNEAFGFEALSAEIASEDDSYADDDVNYLIYDADPTFGAAFANWRTNPNTGEIRGASVYFNGIWFGGALDVASNPNLRVPNPGDKDTKKKVVKLGWAGMSEDRLCSYELRERLAHTLAHQDEVNNAGRTPKEKFEEFITHVILHEVGHTLGLRHNFRGSLVPPSTSVMDYLNDADSIAMGHPGAYDVDAIKYLYGISDAAPTQPFCNDSGVAQAADCARFDTGADPYTTNKEDYQWLVDEQLLKAGSFVQGMPLDMQAYYFRVYMSGVTASAREGGPKAQDALASVWNEIGPGKVNAAQSASAALRATLNAITREAVQDLYLSAPNQRGQVRFDYATTGPLVDNVILPNLEALLANSDGLRDFATRRLVVDTLKVMQTTAALGVLTNARLMLDVEASTLTGDAAYEMEDLMNRISDAVSPYFVR